VSAKAVNDKNVRALGNILQSQKDVPLGDGLIIKTKMDKKSKILTYRVEK